MLQFFNMEEMQERIKSIEKEIRETPYHKGTEHHIGLLRARVAKLKDQMIAGQTRRQGSGGSSGFALRKQGDATVVLVGLPSVGKSTLLNKLTNASSRVATYMFTTVTVIPGMMNYQGARIQILDVPGLIEGAATGRGRGREVLSVVRGADLLLIIADARYPQDFEKITAELEQNGVKVNQQKPRVEIRKASTGGLRLNLAVKQEMKTETIKDICREFRISNAEVTIKERLTMERLIDAFSTNRIYVPVIYVLNKSDLLTSANVPENVILVSAENGQGLESLKIGIWDKLGLVRVYLKDREGLTDYEKPMIVHKSQKLADVMVKIGSEFAEGKKGAKIWGNGSRFPGQSVSLSTFVSDQMEVEFV